MSEDAVFTLIPGRTSRQGSSLNEGKRKADFLDETNTVFVHADDFTRLNLAAGDLVRLKSAYGMADFHCKPGAKDELSPGILFVPYGPQVCQLIGGETHGTGMPDSKCFDVRMSKITGSTTT